MHYIDSVLSRNDKCKILPGFSNFSVLLLYLKQSGLVTAKENFSSPQLITTY